MNIIADNVVIKSLKAFPVLRKRFSTYIKGTKQLPENFSENKLFYDYLKVRLKNPEKRVSMSEYMIFGFYDRSLKEQKKFLTDTEATLLMRPYNSESEPYLKNKVCFLKTFSEFVNRDWLYLPEATLEQFKDFLTRHGSIALKPATSSWGIGFMKLDSGHAEDVGEIFERLSKNKYLAEEYLKSSPELAKYHPSSLNTVRVISFNNADRFEVFGAGLRVGNNGRYVDNAHGGGIFCQLDPKTGRVITDGMDENGNYYVLHPVTGIRFMGQRVPCWDKIIDLCRRASSKLNCLRVVGWDIAVLPDDRLELIEGNHNPGMNIIQAPAKRGVHDEFKSLLLSFYGSADV